MGRYLHIIFAAVVAAAIGAGVFSCADAMYDNSPKGPLELSHTGITVGRAATEVHIGVTARDGAWTVAGSQPWCVVSPAEGPKGISQVTVTFAPNDAEDAAVRTATLTFSSMGETRTIEVEQLTTDVGNPFVDAEFEVNEAIHALLDTWYYNGETRGTPADYNQGYETFFNNYLENLSLNELDGNTWAWDGERYLYSYIDRTPLAEVSDAPPLGYGMEFDLADYGGYTPVARILYVEEASPAAAAGLQRGDWFFKVNENQMYDSLRPTGWYVYNLRIDSLVNPIRGFSPELGMLEYTAGAGRLSDNRRSVFVTPDNFAPKPILHSSSENAEPILIEDVDGHPTRTGYMVYNSFDPEYRDELLSEFERFREQRLTHFVLDLRYNKSGTVEMAELMGDLLVGDVEGVAGKTFARYEFSAGDAAAYNRVATFEAHPAGIGVDTVVVITSRNTAGASELLINALRGIPDEVALVLVGDVTEGMNVGMVHRAHTTEEYRYDAWIAAFRCYNALDQWDWRYGFVPNGGEVDEWDSEVARNWSRTWGWKGRENEGIKEDPLLDRAMEFVEGIARMPGPVIHSSSHQRSGYPREFSVPMNMVMDVDNENP